MVLRRCSRPVLITLVPLETFRLDLSGSLWRSSLPDVLSIAALRRMDISGCLTRYHSRCMQSDWMIGGCARQHNVSELRELGCGTCDPRRLKEGWKQNQIRQRLKGDRCFFLQNAVPFAKELPLGRHAGAIVHGLDNTAAWAFFRKHNHSSAHA